MKISKSLVVLVLVSMPAFAATPIVSNGSGSSFKGTCNTPACCQQHPNAPGCVGSVLRVNCPQCKPTPDAQHRVHGTVTTVKTVAPAKPETGSKPGDPTPTAAPVKATTVRGGKSTGSYKEVAPTPGPTPRPAESSNINSSRSNVD